MKYIFKKFSIFNFQFSNTKGFTLVELLVVIGVLGILAAGLLATIDPLEQFRKGIDSNRKQAGYELINAITRYYASSQVYPWGASSITGAQMSAATGTGILGTLITNGELKGSFTSDTTLLAALYLTYDSSGNLSVCFQPLSKSVKSDPLVVYNQSAASVGTASNTSTLYFCAK